ncbi:MAG: FMN-binding negative transcriptional regulator [Brachymonas sp.]|nr:FMN-binding negative transcriptional regulator [Brachymonas sp.]
MYQPPQFKSTDSAHAVRIMREHPFASLISNDDAGLPFVSHIPLHLLASGDDVTQWKLLGHVAKPNPHWRYLAARPKALVTFMGPQAYMSPAVYLIGARATWSYLAVHAVVQARILEGNEAKDALLKALIADHEPAYAQQWIDLGQAYQHKMLQGIVAFELAIESLECKIKINQHRPESHAAMHAAYTQGSAQEKALAAWMQDLGLAG